MTDAEFIDRVREIADLKDGWLDGEGCKVLPEAIEFAHSIRRITLKPRPYVFPTPQGGLVFEWESVSLEYDASPNGVVAYFITMPHTSVETSKLDIALKLLSVLRGEK